MKHRVFEIRHIQQARLLTVGQVLPDPDWYVSVQRHPHHELMVVLTGSITVASGPRKFVAGAGSVLLYPARVAHEEWSDPALPLHGIVLCFTGPGLNGLPVTAIPDGRQIVHELAARIIADRDTLSAAAVAQKNALLHAILAEFLRSQGAEDQSLVTEVRRHIREHIGDALTLDDLAKVSGLSKFHFLRQYRMATGRTPMRDVYALRAEYARELILSTRLPFKDIAARSGLGDEYSLSRIFRRLFNTPPSHYRCSRQCR